MHFYNKYFKNGNSVKREEAGVDSRGLKQINII